MSDASVFVGMNAKEVRSALGQPNNERANTWHYRLPHYCSETDDLVTLEFANGRVTNASVTHEHTGKICM